MARNLRFDAATNEMNDASQAADMASQLQQQLNKEDSFKELLNKALHDHNAPAAETSKPGHHRRQRQLETLHVDEEDVEGLGDDFESTPWQPPSLDKALEFKANAIFRNGNARIDSVEIVTAQDVGTGTSLYFQFAMSMGVCLFIMSFLSIPSLVFCFYGDKTPAQDTDAFGLYSLTLGNLGFDPTADNYLTKSRCSGSQYSKNDTCITINGNEISLEQVGSVLTAMEILQFVVFLIGVFYVYRCALSVTGRNAKSETGIGDYSVWVTNFPADATDAELVNHFSSLYQLESRDWRGRPALEHAKPVQNCDNSGDVVTLNTWVAECILHKGIGNFLAEFKSKQDIVQRLYRHRARMKMYAENTPHALGHNKAKYDKAEKDMLAALMQIDKLTEMNVKKGKLQFLASPKNGDEAHGHAADDAHSNLSRISNANSLYYHINAKSICAFITFEYSESFARCVRDYDRYSRWPWSMFYPDELKLRGQKLRVRRAPEPDQIIWENLEVSFMQKIYLRTRTNLIAICMIIVCFVLILQASIYKESLSKNIPSALICDSELPTLFANNTLDITELELARPSKNILSYDSQCEAVIPDSFYAIYTKNGNLTAPAVSYSFDACSSSRATAAGLTDGGICPALGQRVFCPCVSTTADDDCRTAACYENSQGASCRSLPTFEASAIGSCYCYQRLERLLIDSGVVETLNEITSSSSECSDFFQEYSLSVGLIYVSIIITTIINIVLRKVLKVLATQEAHVSGDAEQGAILLKIFLSNYATMSIIILVAYGRVENAPEILRTFRILRGPYKDFTTGWYGNVGFYFIVTFILQSFSPLMINLVKYYVIQPLRRWYHHPRVQALKDQSIVTQHDLNMLQVGPIFDPTNNTAQLLTLLFFAMTFAPGLPLLMPLCCGAFMLYFRVDKFLLCRYYQRPPHTGDAAIRRVLSLLPIAAGVRLAFACWMFSNKDILGDADSSTSVYNDFLKTAREQSSGLSVAQDRLFRPNVFPLFILFLILCASIVAYYIYLQLPVDLVFRLVQTCFSVCCPTRDLSLVSSSVEVISGWDLVKLDDPLRLESAGMTKDYFRYVKHKDEIPDTCFRMFTYNALTQMTELELEDGWKMEDHGDYVIKVKLWQKYHKRGDGSVAHRGSRKRTYEVIADHRCNSYNIERVPAYRLATKGLREGAASVLDNPELLSPGRRSPLPMDDGFFGSPMPGGETELDEHVDAKVKHKKRHTPKGRNPKAVIADNGTGAESMVGAATTTPQKSRTKAQTPAAAGGDTATAGANDHRPASAHRKAATAMQGKKANAPKNFTFDDFEALEDGNAMRDTALGE